MENKDLNIGDEVYHTERWSNVCKIGIIIGETAKYWRIQFGKTKPNLFKKDDLYMRGQDGWHNVKAYPLTQEKKERIKHEEKKTFLERRINNFLRVGMSLKSIENGEKILELSYKIKDIIKNDAILGDKE